MKFILTLWISKLAATAVNLIDKARGSSYAGKVALKLMPDFVKYFKNIDCDKVIFISGTNGKSTTTNMVAHTLSSAGKQVACNVEGANMMSGVATTLIKNSSLTGRFKKDILVLEIDERSFPLIRKVLPGHHMGITNLQKDQVQRNGDPDFILRKFRESVGKDMTLYLNNEEPRSRSLEDYAGQVQYFSVAPNDRTYQMNDFYDVTMPCPKCGHPIVYDHYNLSNIGTFHCSKCDYRSSDDASVQISNVDYENNHFTFSGKTWNVSYNNPFYIYNFAMCIAICHQFGLTDAQIQKAFASFTNPASHEDTMTFKGKEVHYLRGKQENPDALQSQIDIITADSRRKAVFIGMHRVEDFSPHYSGTFYLFDCNIEAMVNSNVTSFIAFSQTVANDIASRLILAGADPSAVTICDTNNLNEVFSILDHIEEEVIYVLTNTKRAKLIKEFLKNGGNNHA